MTEVADAAEAVAEDTPLDATVEGQTTEQPGDDGAAETPDGDGGEDLAKPPRRSAQERIDEITRKAKDAERDAEYWKAKALEREQPKQDSAPQPQAAQDPEPDPAEYEFGETDARYVKAVGAWSARQEFARLETQREQRQEQRSVLQSHEQRETEFASTKADYADKVYRAKWDCSPALADAIRTSDDGPAVAYHLATNPTEARRIAALSPLAQFVEFGKIAAGLSVKPAATAKTVSDAPDPAPQARGAGGKFKPAADSDDFASWEAAYNTA